MTESCWVWIDVRDGEPYSWDSAAAHIEEYGEGDLQIAWWEAGQ